MFIFKDIFIFAKTDKKNHNRKLTLTKIETMRKIEFQLPVAMRRAATIGIVNAPMPKHSSVKTIIEAFLFFNSAIIIPASNVSIIPNPAPPNGITVNSQFQGINEYKKNCTVANIIMAIKSVNRLPIFFIR